MALVVFFRGINVGGHRTLRPSVLASELAAYDVVNVGAAGTFIVRKPGSRASFIAQLRRKLPFEAEIALCDGRDLLRLETDNPFGSQPSSPDLVRFVSVFSRPVRCKAIPPITIPEGKKWFVRIVGAKDRLVFGVYRRQMKTIGYLGQTFRRASRNARLEHDTFSAADSESLSANGRKEPPPSALKREDLVG